MWYIRWNIIQPQGRRKSFILTTKMDLEGIMLSEISQTKEDILYGRTYMWNLKKKKKRVILIKQRRENWLSAARWEVGGGDREGTGKRIQTQL